MTTVDTEQTMIETYMAIVKPTPWTWDGLTPLTEGEVARWDKERTHPRRQSFTGYIILVATDRHNWCPGEHDPENVTVQGWTRDECVDALRSEIATRGLTGTLLVTHRDD